MNKDLTLPIPETTRKFQDFEIIGSKSYGQKAIPSIRAKLEETGLDGVFIPHEDEWQNEYVPLAYDRLLYATGFSGSAGAAIILKDNAHIFVDGRCSLQVKEQTDNEIFTYHDLIESGPTKWLGDKNYKGLKIGYNSNLLTIETLNRMRESAKNNAIDLIDMPFNIIDEIWVDRPQIPCAPILPHNIEYTGEDSNSKTHKICDELKAQNIDCFVMTSPMSIAWAYNIRGGDVIRTPLMLANAIIYANGNSSLFVNLEKITKELKPHIGVNIKIFEEAKFEKTLASMENKNVLLDSKLTCAKIFDILEKAKANITQGDDPCTLPRAMKNKIEIEGMKKAHLLDGIALAKFMHWFDINSQSGSLDEITTCKALEAFRAQSGELVDLSFDTISAGMANAASPHYRVNTQSNKILELGSLYLVDSGGQYLCGTTDVTRTIAVGEISEEMKGRFTRVLKGHIALNSVRFPPNTAGSMLDVLARSALWEAGLDYDHGTGHGVGAYLGVHEGPQSISKAFRNVPLRTGMVLSNEPAYYKSGEYGIRIECLQYITEANIPEGGERPMHSFETLTLAPIDKRAIKFNLLNKKEIDWLNNYHAKVAQAIGPYLEGDQRAWLIEATRAI